MARNQSLITSLPQYLALRGVSGFMQCFDAQQNLQLAAAVGRTFCRLNHYRRHRAETNIALSFPDWDHDRVVRTAQQSMEYMFQLFMVDALFTPRLITPQNWPEYVTLGNIAPVIDQLIRRRTGAILLSAHGGNWELLGFYLSTIGFRMAALARPLDNPLINKWLLGIREARGMRIITKWGATPVIQKVLRSGGLVGLVADQNAGDMGLFVPYFGRLASTYKSVGLLAMRYRVPIIIGHARRLDGTMRYEINCADVIEPDDWVNQEDPLYYITARYSRGMERAIKFAPEQYLWLHRRWKSRPRHERKGRPMPERMIRKLRALPWMTESELDEIVTTSSDPDHKEFG